MVALWIFLTIIELCSICIYYKKSGRIFNHLTLFSVGFFLYLILPNLIGEIGLYKGEDFMQGFYSIYDNITIKNKIISYIFIFFIYNGFSFGTIINKKKRISEDIKETKCESKNKKINLFKVVGIILLVLVIIYSVLYKDAFFKGYLADNAYSRGSFAALVLVVFSYSLLYTLIKIKNGQKLWKALLNPYAIIYCLITILLLSMGTRMYFIANVFTILIVIENIKKLSIKKSIFCVLGAVLIVGVIGVIRSDYVVSISVIIINILIEFLYTGLSLIKFIEIGVFELINFPKFILSNFVNLIPTMIFPDKLKYVLNPSDYGYIIYNPQGATSIYIELMINFGIIGSIIIAFLSGYGLDRIRRRTDNILYTIIYSMISGFLIFSIFRDGTIGGFTKNILEFSILLPIFYYFIYRISYKAPKNEKTKPTVLQINVSSNGSTGNIMRNITKYAEEENITMLSFYGRGPELKTKNSYKIASKIEVFCNVFFQRMFARGEVFSFLKTQRLLRKIKKINPDVIHIHNIHGYYINYKSLFKYIIKNQIKVVWTLHDCWAFTGHCVHYSNNKCQKWKKECYECTALKEYPKTLYDNSKKEYKMKKELFTSVKDLSIITPSVWLKEEVKKSFLKKYNVNVIHNGIDLEKFKYIENIDLKIKYNVEDKKIILGVASNWNASKGLEHFIELSKVIKNDEVIFLVGLNKKQIKKLPSNIIGINRTENLEELVKIYSMADVFFNPSMEETFSLVTVEAMACGTPCVVFNETAVPELINDKVGKIVKEYNIKKIQENIEYILEKGKQEYFENCIIHAQKYGDINYKQYIKLYKQKIEEK